MNGETLWVKAPGGRQLFTELKEKKPTGNSLRVKWRFSFEKVQ